jgi:predicted RNase H-like HicB family nuclease
METVNLTIDITLDAEGLSEPLYVAACREFPFASQGRTVEEALANFREAVTLWLGTASQRERGEMLFAVRARKRNTFTTEIEIPYGQVAGAVG